MKHELKILPQYFEAVQSGEKLFEIRSCKDRDFNKGDTVRLREIEECGSYPHYTGRELIVEITYVTTYEQKPGFCVFGIKEVE